MTFVMLKPRREAHGPALVCAPRLGTLEGKVIGTLWNNRPHGDEFLQQLGEELKARYKVAEVVHRKKVFINSRAPMEVLEELKERCDAVVVGIGD
jgi:hypothetical protein